MSSREDTLKKTVDSYKHSTKWLFIGLSWLLWAIYILFIAALIYLIAPRLSAGGSILVWVVMILAGLSIIVLGGGLFLITLTAITGKDLLYPHGGMQITMRIFPPIVIFLGELMGIQKDTLLESMVHIKNALFEAQRHRISGKRVLILLPHCLQYHECPWRVTWSVENCRRCGKCAIGELAPLIDENIQVYVATGGTIARRILLETRPTVIIAVACPRDLASGMIDAYPFPVYGILNERPNGPCFDTKVDVDKIKDVLKSVRNE